MKKRLPKPIPSEPDGSELEKGTKIRLSCSDEAAKIYYTLDGTDPTTGSTLYAEPIQIDAAVTIKAIAVREGFFDSDVAVFTYTVKDSGSGGNSGDDPVGPGEETVEYTVKFMVDGAEHISRKVAKDAKVEAPEAPVKEGYKFLGWYDGEALYDFTKPVTADLTLAAKWEKLVDYGEIEEEDRTNIQQGFWVAGVEEKVEYTGKAITFDDMRVYFGNRLLTKTVDYSVSYKNNVKVGKEATVTITGKGNYSGTYKVTFEITEPRTADISIAKATVKNWVSSQVYTGDALTEDTAELYLKDGTKLTKDEHYTVTYKNNVNVGTATVLFRGKGDYYGTVQKTFKIKALSIADGTVLESSCTPETVPYAKSGAKPQVTVTYKHNGKVLKEGKDYTLTYTGNKKIGEAYYTIKGKGNFKGSVKGKTFQVGKQGISGMTVRVPDVVYKNRKKIYKSKPAVYDADGTALKAGTDYSKTYEYTYVNDTDMGDTVRKAGDPVSDDDIIPVGTKIRVAVTGKNKYSADTEPAYGFFRIIDPKKSIAKATVEILEEVYYTGKTVELEKNMLIVKVNGETLSEDDYEISYYTNNTKKGTAKMTLRGTGSYGGFKTVKFKIKAKPIQ